MTQHRPIPQPKPSADHAKPLMEARNKMAAGAFGEALKLLQPLLAAQPADPQVLDVVADCYWDMGRTAQAMEVMEAMIALWPDLPALLGKRAARYLSLGQEAAAKTDFQSMLRLQPGNLQIISALNVIETFAPDSQEAQFLDSCIARGGLSEAELVLAHNCLGRIHYKGDPTKAMAHFLASKAASAGTYDAAATERRIESQRQHLPAPDSAPMVARAAQDTPVFITGLPRSGTTLMETMLLRHDDITSLGENPALIQARVALETPLVQALCPDLASTDPWAWCSKLPPEAMAQVLAKLATLYGQFSAPRRQAQARWCLDKLPQNVFEMRIAALAMPEARFIFMRRHPLDVGLSLLTNNFHKGHGYSKQQDWIGHYIRANYAALEDCQTALGSRLRQQSYRALVQNPEQEMRAILAHIGADWCADCLHPEDVQGAVRTASVSQVRAGLNLKGLEKWRPFEAELTAMIDALGGWDWIHDWEAQDTALLAT